MASQGLIIFFPRNPVTKLLTTWYGPLPLERESYSSYMFRYALYAFRWLFVIVLVWVSIAWITYSEFDKFPTIFLVFHFALSLLAGMALLGGVALAIKAIYNKYFQQKKIFDKNAGQFQ